MLLPADSVWDKNMIPSGKSTEKGGCAIITDGNLLGGHQMVCEWYKTNSYLRVGHSGGSGRVNRITEEREGKMNLAFIDN